MKIVLSNVCIQDFIVKMATPELFSSERRTEHSPATAELFASERRTEHSPAKGLGLNGIP
jgi:hypothetical protein